MSLDVGFIRFALTERSELTEGNYQLSIINYLISHFADFASKFCENEKETYFCDFKKINISK